MGFQKICEDVVVETEGALGCILIDLTTGLTLASAQRAGSMLDGAEIKTILRSCEDLFVGKLVNRFVASLSNHRAAAAGFVREVQITRAYNCQFMAALPGWDDGVVILITERTLNLGFAWMAVHQVQEQLAEAHRRGGEDPAAHMAGSALTPAAQSHEEIRARESSAPDAPVPPVSSRSPGTLVAPTWQELPPSTESEQAIASPVTVGEPAPESAEQGSDRRIGQKPEGEAPAASAPEAREPEDGRESGRQVAAGARARMFRPRSRKNRKDSQ